jgi:hypothetical protein
MSTFLLRHRALVLAQFALIISMSTTLHAKGMMDKFIDKDDGWLDVSKFLEENAFGFLPLPIVITDPAVGNGLGVAGLKLFKPKEGDPLPKEGEYMVTDMAVVAAAYTNSGTWFVGGQYFNSFRQDTLRYTGTAGYANVNLEWFGGSGGIFENGVEFDVKGYYIDQEMLYRMGSSDWFLGLDLRYLNSTTAFNSELPIDPPALKTSVSGLGIVGLYEHLNSRFSPTNGLSVEFTAQKNDKAIGSDFDYNEYSWKIRKYFLFANKYTLGLRLDGASTSGDVPFYLEPYVDIEGIQGLRYQGPTAATAEVRAGWDFHPRWTAMAFVGAGRTGENISDLGSASSHVSKGVGFRYLMAKKFGLRSGIDVAWGPEDTFFYLVVGSAWR